MEIGGRNQETGVREPKAAESPPAAPAPMPPSVFAPPQIDRLAAEDPAARPAAVHPGAARKPGRLLRILVLLLVIALSAGIALYGDRLSGLGAYGYPGLFILNALASATLILPAPGLALAFGAGASLEPWLVGLAVGAGSTFGELTGYLAGFSGRGVIEDQALYNRVRKWMDRHGLWVIFLLALVPNPLFDLAGITAGVTKIPVWKFLAAAGVGKVIKATLVAFAGAETMSILGPVIQDWLAR